MKAIDLPVGAATSIGSLPHEAPDQAVALVLDEHRGCRRRHAPRRSPLEGMIAQAAWGMPGVTVLDDGSLDLVLDAIDPEAPPPTRTSPASRSSACGSSSTRSPAAPAG